MAMKLHLSLEMPLVDLRSWPATVAITGSSGSDVCSRAHVTCQLSAGHCDPLCAYKRDDF
eukprot:467231-Rhodomonas_salina.1